MDGQKRREQIIQQLQQSEGPLSASRLAKEFQVSRQIVVGDIALLRASGTEILATARGYLLAHPANQAGQIYQLACCHAPEETAAELRAIVGNGGEVIDVIVDHSLYGELSGKLYIRTEKDIESFLKKQQKNQVGLLSELTHGVHLHTIRCTEPEDLQKIQTALKELGILYQDSVMKKG